MALQDDWYRPTLTLRSRALLPLSRLYSLLRRVRPSRAVRARVSGRIVIVIGNVTVGGTGKTPLTTFIAEALTVQGHVVGVVTRGYPASPREPIVIAAKSTNTCGANLAPLTGKNFENLPSAEQVGDEALLYAQRGLPTAVCASRTRAVDALIAQIPAIDVILADDALQHTALSRNIEIALIDGERGFGNGALLPAGPLREPVARLNDVDAVVVNSGDFQFAHPQCFRMDVAPTQLRRLSDGNIITDFRNEFSIDRKIAVIAGLGNPERYFRAVRGAFPDIQIAATHAFPDHHAYTVNELNALNADAIIMSEKDCVKCAKIAPNVSAQLYATDAHVRVEPDIIAWLHARIRDL